MQPSIFRNDQFRRQYTPRRPFSLSRERVPVRFHVNWWEGTNSSRGCQHTAQHWVCSDSTQACKLPCRELLSLEALVKQGHWMVSGLNHSRSLKSIEQPASLPKPFMPECLPIHHQKASQRRAPLKTVFPMSPSHPLSCPLPLPA